MPTMTQVFREARSLRLRDRAKLVSKLIALDMPGVQADMEELGRREQELRAGEVPFLNVADAMREARVLAGIGGKPPRLKVRKVKS